MEQFNTFVNENFGWVHENEIIFGVLTIFLAIYVALARPTLPNYIAKLFENPIFRLVMISYIIYRGNKDPQLSLMIAGAFLITMHMLNRQKVEGMTDVNMVYTAQGSCSSGNMDMETKQENGTRTVEKFTADYKGLVCDVSGKCEYKNVNPIVVDPCIASPPVGVPTGKTVQEVN